ncbi:MAG TPA: hypothetical protein VGI58_09720 [Streptosporangiaceae bacterium]|jgi:hypothetical protein
MPTDPRLTVLRYLAAQLRYRLDGVRHGGLDRGALSLEWVAIAIVLVTAALALAAFLAGKLHDLESLIPS